MKVKVNEHYDFEVDVTGNDLMVDGSAIEIDSRSVAPGHSHVIYKHKSYNIELVSENRADKTSVVKVNGHVYQVAISDQYDLLLKQLGMDNNQAGKVKDVKAPMPGLVLSVLVEEGQEVNKGDNLLVLEAMKMENIIKSPSAGIIKKVTVSKGVKVEKNEILIHFA
jgi:biotin carboxyl carrier protein